MMTSEDIVNEVGLSEEGESVKIVFDRPVAFKQKIFSGEVIECLAHKVRLGRLGHGWGYVGIWYEGHRKLKESC